MEAAIEHNNEHFFQPKTSQPCCQNNILTTRDWNNRGGGNIEHVVSTQSLWNKLCVHWKGPNIIAISSRKSIPSCEQDSMSSPWEK